MVLSLWASATSGYIHVHHVLTRGSSPRDMAFHRKRLVMVSHIDVIGPSFVV